MNTPNITYVHVIPFYNMVVHLWIYVTCSTLPGKCLYLTGHWEVLKVGFTSIHIVCWPVMWGPNRFSHEKTVGLNVVLQRYNLVVKKSRNVVAYKLGSSSSDNSFIEGNKTIVQVSGDEKQKCWFLFPPPPLLFWI